MTTKASATIAAARKELRARIASVQKMAGAARKRAKGAKLVFRHAKKKLKEAKRAARKLRKSVKALQAELAALAARRRRKKPVARKPATQSSRSIAIPAPAVAPVEAPPAPADNPPVMPGT